MAPSAIEEIKTYCTTPEGKDWFMNTLADAQRHQEHERKARKTVSKADVEAEWKRQDEAKAKRDDPITVSGSRGDIEAALAWNKTHSDGERYAFYLKRDVIKTALKRPSERLTVDYVSMPDTLSGDSIEVTMVSTGKRYAVTLTD